MRNAANARFAGIRLSRDALPHWHKVRCGSSFFRANLSCDLNPFFRSSCELSAIPFERPPVRALHIEVARAEARRLAQLVKLARESGFATGRA
jgi:hypothetical protein